jgi:acetyl-CoA acetyltransferase
MSQRELEKSVIISGIGQSEVGRPAQASPMRLTVDACLQAIADAGLERGDIDGVTCWPGDHNNNGDSFSPIGSHAATTALGLNVNWYSGGYEGPGPISAVFQAAMAIATGLCRHVLVFRTIAESSARHADRSATALTSKTPDRDGSYMWRWYTPFKVYSAINLVAMFAQRHMHEFGTTSEHLGEIALNARRHAALNPKAVFRTPMTMDDYLASRMISTPLRMYDCDVHCDASTALVLSHVDSARDLRNPPIRLEAIGSALEVPHSWDQLPLTDMAAAGAARMMWRRTSLTPADVDVAQLYDGFTILTMLWLEAMGFCHKGESGAFVAGGKRIAHDGELPLNTNGGQLSAGRTHGLGFVHEACTQLWGRGDARQVPGDPRVAAVAAGGGPLAGCMLLVRD